MHPKLSYFHLSCRNILSRFLRVSRKGALSFVALVTAISSVAQDYVYQTGTPVFSTLQPVQFGFVNLANGNVHLEIPLASAPQRGSLGLTAKLVYDSRIWQVVRAGGSLLWKPTNVPNSMGGWRFVTTADPGAVTFDTTNSPCGGTLFTSNFSNFVWQSAEGTKRKFALATAQNMGCGVDVRSADGFATDSSGYHMYVTNYNSAVVYAKDGTQVFPRIQDTNGNHFSTDANGNIIDTLGRTLATKSVNGNQTFYDVPNSQGTSSRITVATRSILVSTFFRQYQSGITDDQENITVIDSVTLPTGDTYTFNYDEAVLNPPGWPPGTVTPGYGMLQSSSLSHVGTIATYNYTPFIDVFGVVNRWATSTFEGSISYSVLSSTQQQATLTSNLNSNSLVFTFLMNGGAWNTDIATSAGFYDSMHVTNNYDLTQNCAGCQGAANVRLLSTVRTLTTPAGPVSSRTEFGYDSPVTANVTSVKSWNFYAGDASATPPGSPRRQVFVTYNTDQALLSKNIVNRVKNVSVQDGAGVQEAQTAYEYDTTALAPLSAAISNHDDNIDSHRGNLTHISRWTGGNSFLDSYLTFDASGQIVQAKDPAGNISKVSYGDNFYNDNNTSQLAAANPSLATNAYPTKLTLPIVGDISIGYYLGTGKQALVKDQNGQVTYQHFADPLDRLTSIISPKGWEQFVYPSLLNSEVFTGLTDTQPSTSCTGCIHQVNTTDILGRVTQSTLLSDPDGPISSEASYDFAGHVLTASNPHRGTVTHSSTSSYDMLGRALGATQPDGSATRIYYGAGIVSSLDPTRGGNTNQLCPSATYGVGFPILSINEAGKRRQVWLDAFGEVIEADEPDANGALNVATCYQYNTGGELTNVVQGALQRTYEYDRLWRTKRVTTPEAGAETYNYVNDDGSLCSGEASNVCQRVDARGIVTRFQYDALGRLKRKTYTDGTPTAVFNYDESVLPGAFGSAQRALTNTVGRPSSIYTQDSTGRVLTGEIFSYDVAGNVIDNSQCTPQNCGNGLFTNTFKPNLLGDITEFDNSWGRNVTATLDNTAKVTSLNVSGSDATHPASIFSNAKFDELGGLISATLGNGLYEAADNSNTRGWLNSLRVGKRTSFGQQPGGNVATPGSTTITLSGSVQQTNTSATPGTATLTVSGSEQTSPNGTQPATPSSATLVINGTEQVKQIVEVPGAPGTGSLTLSGGVQSKQTGASATSGTGSFAITGALQTKAASSATAGSGSISFSGAEQSTTVGSRPATQATGSLTITGSEQSTVIDPCYNPDLDPSSSRSCPRTIYDNGTVSITINGHTNSIGYGSGSAPSTIASGLASAINGDTGAFVNASVSNGLLTLTARQAGTVGNYSWSLSSSSSDASGNFGPGGSFSSSPASGSLSGGANASGGTTVYDLGACSATVNGTTYSTNFGQTDSTSTIVSRLANAISAGTLATSTASGSTLSLVAKQTGTSSNYPISAACTYNSSNFSHASFTASTSGSTFTGGSNGSPAVTDSGTVSLAIGPTFTASACYGLGGSCTIPAGCSAGDSTVAQVACSLASSLNRSGSPVNATVSGSSPNIINLTALQQGASTNYSLSASSTYLNSSFASASFASSPSGATLTGGRDANPGMPLYDAGTVSVNVGGFFTASAAYGKISGNGTWTSEDLTAFAASSQRIHPVPLTTSDPASPFHLFYQDTNQHLHKLWRDSNGGHDQDVTASAGSPPLYQSNRRVTGYMASAYSPEHVFFLDAAMHIHHLWTDSVANWHDQDITVAAGAPAAIFSTDLTSYSDPNPNSPQKVFYQTGDLHIHEMWSDASGNWHDQDNTAIAGAAPAPQQTFLMSFIDPSSNSREHVFYEDTSLHIHEMFSDASGWHDRDLIALTGAPLWNTTNAPISVLLDPNSNAREHVFYVPTDGHVHHLWMDSSGWHHEDAQGLAGATYYPGAVSALLYPTAQSRYHVFCTTNDQHLHQLWQDSSGWHDEDETGASLPYSPTGLSGTALFGVSAHVFATDTNNHLRHLLAGSQTAADLASDLANNLNTGFNRAGSPVTATVSGPTLNLSSMRNGSVANYSLTISSSFDSADFATPSFTPAASGPTLTGGIDDLVTPLYDSGTLSVLINNHQDTIDWGQGAAPQNLASTLATTVNLDPAAAVTAVASGNQVKFTTKTVGANTAYTFLPSVTHDTADFDQTSFTALAGDNSASLSGGHDVISGTFDTGTVTVTVNGFSKSVAYTQQDNPLRIASNLAVAFNTDPNSPVSVATQSANNQLLFAAKKAGSNSNYSVSTSSASTNSNFTGPSFTASFGTPTLTGGADSGPTTTTMTDLGQASLAVGSFTATVTYGNNPYAIPRPACCTAAAVAAALGNVINQSPSSPVIAAAVGPQITLTAKTGGSNTNYSYSTSARSDDTVHFPSGSFSFSQQSGSLVGGANKQNSSQASSATASVAISGGPWNSSSGPCNGVVASVFVNGQEYRYCSGAGSVTAASVAAGLAQVINSGPVNVSATVSGSTLFLQTITGGTSTNYPISVTVNNTSNLVPITAVVSGPVMTGGTDQGSFVYALDVGIDSSGTVFSANDSINGNWTYLYDNLNRLEQAFTPSVSYQYDYDRYGNRLHQTPLNGGSSSSLLYTNNQIVDPAVQYDASGNMIRDGNHTYTYDAENRLIAVDGGQTATYTYSAEGMRVRSAVGAAFSDFVHDLGGDTVGVLGTNGALIRQEFGGLATYNASGAYFHHRDWLGNLRAITDQTGSVQQTCKNLPFGDSLVCTASGITPTDFTGYMRDGETQLDFANARYFTSQFARFMSVDPLGGDSSDPQSLNPYAYALNNPSSLTDPSGMDPCGGLVLCYSGGGGSGSGPFSAGGPFGSSGGSFGGGSISFCFMFDCGFGAFGGPTIPGPPSAAQLAAEASFLSDPQAGVVWSAVEGGMVGGGGGTLWALNYQSLLSKQGAVKFGYFTNQLNRFGNPDFTRTFHLSAPDKYTKYFHFNADAGPLRPFNHVQIPEWAYKLGREPVMRGVGKTLLVGGLIMDTIHIATASRCDRAGAIGGVAGGWGGGIALGAAFGSIVPGIGTIVGGIVGGILGGIGGEWLGNKIGRPAGCI